MDEAFGDMHQQGVQGEAEDPPAEEILADPEEPVDRVNALIQTSQWELLVEYLINLMPTMHGDIHPSLVHPIPFLTVWRRQVMDLIDGGAYVAAAQIFDQWIVPLRRAKTAYAFSEKLNEEITEIENSVGNMTSVAHAHCGTPLMQKLVNDYLRFYLPNTIGYVSPKALSAMWEFAVRLDTPVPGVKRHPDIRCLVCSEQEYTKCNIGVKMKEHLQVCPGFTPEAVRRYMEAQSKEESKRRRLDNDNIMSPNKAPKVTMASDPLHLICQQIEEARGILDGMSSIQQDHDVALGIDVMKRIMGNMRELVTLAQRQQAPPAAQVTQAPQAHLPLVLAPGLVQAAVPAQVSLQAPPAPQPVPAPGPVQAAQVPLQAPPAAQPVLAPGPVQAAQVPLQAPLAPQPAPALADLPDYYQVFQDLEGLDDLPSLSD